MSSTSIAALAIALSVTAVAAPAFAFDAVVTNCHDGDTCALADGTRVRLHGVDAPELDQPYGAQSRLLINSLVAGHHVDVRPTGDLSYGRTVADIVLPDGRDVGAVLVASGAAWVESRWNHDPAAYAAQDHAQRAHLGLWADSTAIPPWQWRNEHGAGHSFTWRTR
jgi:endonuclease YncB( thermonuclease family)